MDHVVELKVGEAGADAVVVEHEAKSVDCLNGLLGRPAAHDDCAAGVEYQNGCLVDANEAHRRSRFEALWPVRARVLAREVLNVDWSAEPDICHYILHCK